MSRLSNVTTYTYDVEGNLETVTNELDEVTTYTVNAAGQVTEVEDDLTHTTTYGYDVYGNRETVTNALNKTWTYVYDLGGRVETVTDPLSHVTTYTYDDANRVLTETNDLSEVTTYDYDPKGNRISVIDAENNETTFAYDDADRLETVTDELLNVTTYAYDGVGNRTSVTNPLPETTTYTYDGLGRRLTVTDPNTEVTTFVYDLAGRVTSRTDARGLETEYGYDDAGRLTAVDYYDGISLEATVDYTYDDVGNVTQMVDGTGTTTYVYDDLHRLTSVTAPTVGEVEYTYDEVGNRETITYPDTSVVTYGYDDANQLTSVTDWLSNVTSYTYDDAGRLTEAALPNGVDADYTYDDADRLLSVTNADGGGTISSFTYTLDNVGNRVQMVDNLGTHTYTLDDLYRLTQVVYPGPTTHTYTYDDNGNRLAKNTDDYTYDAADGITDVEGVTWVTDENGNVTDRGSDTFAWDHENRMTESVVSSVTTTYTYNGAGLRASRAVSGGATVDYAWDVAAALPVVVDDGTYKYVYGLDLIAAVEDDTTEHYLLYDGLGSVTEVTDDTGDVEASFRYDVFGAVRSSSGSTDLEFRFTGEQADPSGFYFLRARYYDPATGRFLSRDTIEFSQRYVYGLGNPTSYIDRDGRFAVAIFAAPLVYAALTAGAALVVCDLTSCEEAVVLTVEETTREIRNFFAKRERPSGLPEGAHSDHQEARKEAMKRYPGMERGAFEEALREIKRRNAGRRSNPDIWFGPNGEIWSPGGEDGESEYWGNIWDELEYRGAGKNKGKSSW